jgi:hypothetical protein
MSDVEQIFVLNTSPILLKPVLSPERKRPTLFVMVSFFCCSRINIAKRGSPGKSAHDKMDQEKERKKEELQSKQTFHDPIRGPCCGIGAKRIQRKENMVDRATIF